MATIEERRATARNSYELELERRLSALKETASSTGPLSTARRALVKKCDDAEADLETVRGHIHHREPNILVHNQILFWVGSSFIFAVEAFLNKIIVDMAAQTAGGVSLLVSALVSVTLVAIAHWSGLLWRQIRSDSQRRFLFWNLVLGSVMLVLLFVAVLAIMALRAYFAVVNTTTVVDIFSDAVASLKELGPEFVLRVFGVPESATLGGLNILALLVAFLFGFFSHDSDHQYDSALRKVAKNDARLMRQEAGYERILNRIYLSFRGRIEQAQAAFVANKGVLSELPLDDFKAQRAIAEGERPPVPADPVEPEGRPPPANVTVLPTKAAAGNPW